MRANCISHLRASSMMVSRWQGVHQGKPVGGPQVDSMSGSFADGDGAVGGAEDDFHSAAGAVFAFEVSVAILGSGLVESGAGKLVFDIAGVAIADDFEARAAGQTERDAGRGIRDLNVVLWRRGIADANVAVAIVDVHFAARIFDGDVGGRSAESEIARRIHNFKIAGLDSHVAGELGNG